MVTEVIGCKYLHPITFLLQIKIGCVPIKKIQPGQNTGKIKELNYQSPHCTILMGQRLRDRECEFVPIFKYGTVKSKKPLVSIGKCCHLVADHYPIEHIIVGFN